MKITQLGKALDNEKYIIDKKSKSFSTTEDNLVLDFSDEYGWVFKTGSDCTFKTGSYCTFNTGSYCTFNTGSDCTFKTGSYCTFDTGYGCTFDTDSNCTFDTGSYCTFKTGSYCTFDTGSNCVAVRRDIYEVIEIPEGKKIKINEYGTKGWKEAEKWK